MASEWVRKVDGKPEETELRGGTLFFFLIAHFGWFLFSALTDTSETDQFLFDSHTTTKHTHLYVYTSESLH